MKKFLLAIIAIITLLSMFVFVACDGCDSDETPPSITLNKTELSMSLFGEAALEATITGDLESLTWSNNAESVVTLTSDGNKAQIIAIGGGNAVITVSSGDYSAECKVKVEDSGEKMLLNTAWSDDLVEMIEGSELLLGTTVKFEGKDFDKSTVKYEVADTNIVSVSEKGLIKGLAVGSTTVKVYAEYHGYLSNVKEINVVVKPLVAVKLSLANLEIYEPSDKPYFTSSAPLSVYFQNGENEIALTDGQFQIDNTAPTVAEFVGGNINALASGSAELKISYNFENVVYTSKVMISVKELPVVEFNLKKDAVKLHDSAGEFSYETSASLDYYAYLDNKQLSSEFISYEVTKGSTVVSVSEDGVIQAIGVGNASVKATADYHGIIITDECLVEVQQTVTGVCDFDASVITEGHTDVTYELSGMPENTLMANKRILTYEWKQTQTTTTGDRYITISKDTIGKNLFKAGNYFVFDAYVAECKDLTFRYRNLAVYDMDGYKIDNAGAYTHLVAQRKWFKVAVEITEDLVKTPKINMGDKICSVFISDARIYTSDAYNTQFTSDERPLSPTGIEEFNAELFYNGHSAAANVSYLKQDMTGDDAVNVRAETYAWTQLSEIDRYLYINYPLAGKALKVDSYLVLDVYISSAVMGSPEYFRFRNLAVYDSSNQPVDNSVAATHQVQAKTWYQVAIKLTSDIISAKRFSFGDKECTLYISGAKIYTATAYANTFGAS